MTYFVMKNKVPGCVINIMLIVIHYIEIRHAILCNTAKTVHMEKVVFILYRNEKLLIYHFHQETNSIVQLVAIVIYNTFLTSFAVYVKKA